MVPVKLWPVPGPNSEIRLALRGAALTFVADPFEVGVDAAMRYESDAIVAMEAGTITHFGTASDVTAKAAGGHADTPGGS